MTDTRITLYATPGHSSSAAVERFPEATGPSHLEEVGTDPTHREETSRGEISREETGRKETGRLANARVAPVTGIGGRAFYGASLEPRVRLEAAPPEGGWA